jgi:hypothetical protein
LIGLRSTRAVNAAMAGALSLGLQFVITDVSGAQSNTGSIVGQVFDPAGKQVAGASVTARNTDLSIKRTVVTDQSGSFRIQGLVPGAITVEGKVAGLATKGPVRLTLGLGSTVHVIIKLAIPSVAQRATVNARGGTSEGNTLAPPVNKDEATVSSFFTGNMTTYLPNRDRDFTQFGQFGAGVSEDATGSGVIIAGQRSSSTLTQVDGASFNDPLQGGRRGAGDGTFFLPQTVVREFQIVRSGVTAEVGGTNSGLINVATKEGSNKLHGEAFYTVRPAWATSADAFGHSLENRQNTFGASFGGPIKRDKIFYYLGVEQDFLQAPYFTQFEPQAQGVVLPASLAGLQGQVFQKSSPTAIFGRGDIVLNSANTLNVELAANRIRGSRIGNGSSRSTATRDNASSLSGQSLWSKASLTSVLTPQSVNQALVSWSGDHRNSAPGSTAPQVVINGVGTLGGDALGPHLFTSNQLQLADTISFSHGGSLLEFGAAFAHSPAYEQQEANMNGRFDFNSLADYLANRPRRYQQTFPTGDTTYRGSLHNLSLFADAKVPFGTRLTLTAGLRWDGRWNPRLPRPNPAIALTNSIPNDLSQWQPRLGLAWTATRKTVVRLSSGIYAAPTPATIFHRAAVDNGLQTIVADSYFDPQILALAASTSHAFAAPPPGLTTPAALVIGISPDLRNPRSLQVAASVEQEIKPQFVLSAGYLHNSTWRLQRRVDKNLGLPNAVSAGLPIFPTTRPNPTIGMLLVNESTAHSSYDGLLLTANWQISRRSQLLIYETVSQTHDDDSGTGPYGIDAALNPYNLQAEKAYSAQDVRNVLNVSAIFNLPLGFKCNPVFLTRTGRPYTPIIGFDTQHDANDWNDRALINGSVAGRNSMRQPDFYNIDVRFVKDFTLRGVGHHLDLFMDVFNLTGASNRNFGRDSVSVYGSATATIASAGQALFAPDGTHFGGPRAIQFTARLVAF